MKKISLNTFVILALSLFALACTSKEQSTEETTKVPSKKVISSKVKKVDFQESVFASGKLSSKEESKLSFKTGGVIKKIHVREGQYVKKGQLLVELDLDEIRAQVQQANLGKDQSNITINNAKLAIQLAERDYKNALGLYQDSVATLEQLENAEVQLNNARNQLEAAKKGLDYSQQNIELANFNLKYSKITAPSSGTILKKVAEVNELVGPGTPVIFFGSKDKAQVLRVNLTDKDIIHVQLNDAAHINFDAYPKFTFEGTVREIASMADPYTGTYEVEIEVVPNGKRLLSGFIGTVNIFTDSKTALFEIPVDALIGADKNQGDVFLVQNGKAIKTKVGIHKIRGDQLLINNGLNEADEVIISGVGYLEHNENVMISKN